jgi:hypothetical protein
MVFLISSSNVLEHLLSLAHSHFLPNLLPFRAGCACAAAQGAERVGAPIPNHKFGKFAVVVYFIDNPCAFVSHQLFSVAFITLIIDNFTCHV